MRKVIVTTCGISLITNDAPEALRKMLSATANKTEEELDREDKQQADTRIAARATELEAADLARAARICAELNGIIALYQGDVLPRDGQPDMHFLICTDTYYGFRVAEILKTWLEGHAQLATIYKVSGLSTASLGSFRLAMSDLVKWCDETLPAFEKGGWRIVFNLTGGFKSVQGYMQTLGMFYAHESVYLFETSTELLRIPRLPIRMSAEDTFSQHLHLVRRMHEGYVVSPRELGDLPESLYMIIDDSSAVLSDFGRLQWLQSRPHFYGRELLAPLSSKLEYAPSFLRDVEGLRDNSRIYALNCRMDQLSRYLDLPQHPNPDSLGFKMLKAPPVPDATHECYAWSDRDAKRIFGHFEGERFVILHLREHL